MTSFLEHAGYLALIIFAFVEACSIPISSEVTFGVAGFLAYQGHLNLILVIVIGSLAELAGSYVSYLLGRRGGRPAIERVGKNFIGTRDLDRAERFFAGRGTWAVAVARVVPLVRAFVGLVAGFMEVPRVQFVLYNLLGTVVWATTLSVAGYELGSHFPHDSKRFSTDTTVIGVLVLVLLVATVGLRVIQVRRERKADAAGQAADAAPQAPAPEPPGRHRTTQGR
jgi:membrane protein DedA with SNARE-associated domain